MRTEHHNSSLYTRNRSKSPLSNALVGRSGCPSAKAEQSDQSEFEESRRLEINSQTDQPLDDLEIEST
jgi:hypothetical protein